MKKPIEPNYENFLKLALNRHQIFNISKKVFNTLTLEIEGFLNSLIMDAD